MCDNPLKIMGVIEEEGFLPLGNILRVALLTVELLEDSFYRLIATGDGALYLGLDRGCACQECNYYNTRYMFPSLNKEPTSFAI